MSLRIERVAIVSANAASLCTLLNVTEEQHFIQNCMSPEVFQECVAGDSNVTRIQILCEKVIHEILSGSTKMYDALCEYFLERSEAYKRMHQRFSSISSTNDGSNSFDAKSEFLQLQEKVQHLTQELQHLREAHPLTVCQTEFSTVQKLLTEEKPVTSDLASSDTLQVEKFELEATARQPFLLWPQLSPYGNDMITSVKEETEVAENGLAGVCSNSEQRNPGQHIENENSHDDDGEFGDSAFDFSAVNENRHMCEYCGKTFRWRSFLVLHVRGHTGEKPYVCKYCSKRYRWQSHLVRHVRGHTGEKPFVCENCGKGFLERSHLLRHVRVHTRVNIFPCEVCGKMFSRKSHLVKHARVHSGEKFYSCEHCGNAFRSNSAMLKHVGTKHSAAILRMPPS